MERNNYMKHQKKINSILQKASTTQYYNSLFESCGIKKTDIFNKSINYEQFIKIPILQKKELNEKKFKMLTNSYSSFNETYYKNLSPVEKRKYMEKLGLEIRITSGSTGIPIEVIKSKEDLKRDYIMLTLMRKKLTDYHFKGNFVWISPVNPIIKKSFYNQESKWWQVNKYGVQYMLYEHSYKSFRELYEFIILRKIEWITSSPTIIEHFCDFLVKNNLSVDSLKYIECHSENLTKDQRTYIQKVLGVQPISIYSSNEVQFMGVVYEKQCLNVFENACFIECIDNEFGSKDICVTSLNYKDIPIIRYNLGDCGQWMKAKNNDVGSKQMIRLSMFRKNDYIVLENGNRMEPFVITDSIVLLNNKFNLIIKRYRVLQKSVRRFIYYFQDENCLCFRDEIKLFLEKYLSTLLKVSIIVDVKFENSLDVPLYQKYKYFEVDQLLQNIYKLQ